MKKCLDEVCARDVFVLCSIGFLIEWSRMPSARSDGYPTTLLQNARPHLKAL